MNHANFHKFSFGKIPSKPINESKFTLPVRKAMRAVK
jgi:hypothetical protein